MPIRGSQGSRISADHVLSGFVTQIDRRPRAKGQAFFLVDRNLA